ncbi:hypothetical protein [Streptomyces sp. JB150]|uniref:hypothetical protein n=1 Tax=Streptomyces sp. JB150 TaxID=2714844 RepID=UPI001F0F697A|nr:hypothetical protein [Streptomyces sp. JB150]
MVRHTCRTRPSAVSPPEPSGTPVPVPSETHSTTLLERAGIGPAHDGFARDDPLMVQDIVVHLTHSRVTEQRACEQMRLDERLAGRRRVVALRTPQRRDALGGPRSPGA